MSQKDKPQEQLRLLRKMQRAGRLEHVNLSDRDLDHLVELLGQDVVKQVGAGWILTDKGTMLLSLVAGAKDIEQYE